MFCPSPIPSYLLIYATTVHGSLFPFQTNQFFPIQNSHKTIKEESEKLNIPTNLSFHEYSEQSLFHSHFSHKSPLLVFQFLLFKPFSLLRSEFDPLHLIYSIAPNWYVTAQKETPS